MSRLIFSIAAVAVVALVSLFCGILPQSPFLAYLNWTQLHDYLGYINYFLPISEIIVISEAWLLCIAPWLLAQNCIKAIKILGEYIPFT
ncbi:MAG: hypothetical protein ACI4EE_00420 [Lachnospiraceae bacterium]